MTPLAMTVALTPFIGAESGDTFKRVAMPDGHVLRVRVRLTGSGEADDKLQFIISLGRGQAGIDRPLSRQVLHDVCARLPEREMLYTPYDRDEYAAPLTTSTVFLLETTVGRDSIIFEDDKAALEYYALLAFWTSGASAATQRARFAIDGIVPELPADAPQSESSLFPLMPHQRACWRSSLDQPAALWLMEQGTGKTAAAIAEASYLANRLDRRLQPDEDHTIKVLIVCPASVQLNWVKELEKFAACDYRVSVMRGNTYGRLERLYSGLARLEKERLNVVVCGWEVAARDVDRLTSVPWDYVIFDESHYAKTPTTSRAKAARKIARASAATRLLTGTPISGRIRDLYSQLEIAADGASGFSELGAFEDYYEAFENVEPYGARKVTGWQNLPYLQEALARMSFRARKRDVLKDLPPQTFELREVSLSTKQRKAYRDLRDKLMVEVAADLARGGNRAMTVQNVLVKLLRLTQITSGFMILDADIDPITREEISGKEVIRFDENPKLAELLTMIDETDELEKVIVWCQYREDVRAIQEALTAKGIKSSRIIGTDPIGKRDDSVNAFNCDPSVKVFVGTSAGGTGLNLLGYDHSQPPELQGDTNASLVVFFSYDWSPIKRDQMTARAHRKGSRVPVRYVDLMAAGTIDGEIVSRVKAKTENSEQVQDLTAILGAIRNANPEE